MAWADRPPGEQAALTYCAPRGIPLSVFLGRTVYPGEPQWLPDDTAAAFDWLEYHNGLCGDCGQSLNETVGKANFDTWNAKPIGTCDACRALHRASQVAAGNDDLSPTVGMRFRVWRDEEAG